MTLNINAPSTATVPSYFCPTGDVDESRDPLKLLLKENDIIKKWQTALRGTTELSRLMSIYQPEPCVSTGCTPLRDVSTVSGARASPSFTLPSSWVASACLPFKLPVTLPSDPRFGAELFLPSKQQFWQTLIEAIKQ